VYAFSAKDVDIQKWHEEEIAMLADHGGLRSGKSILFTDHRP